MPLKNFLTPLQIGCAASGIVVGARLLGLFQFWEWAAYDRFLSWKPNDVLDDPHQLAQAAAEFSQLIYSCRIDFEMIVEFNKRRHLVYLITYLLENALEALNLKIKSDPIFLPELKLWINAQEENLILTVEDNGIGMSQEELSKAFEPLVSFTNKLGLGLFQSQQIVNQFEGTIKLESEAQKLTKATVLIPLNKLGKMQS